MNIYKIKDTDIECIITRKKCKNVLIKVSADGVVKVTAPRYVLKGFITSFIEQKRDWIFDRLDKINDTRVIYEDGSLVSFLGKDYELQVKESKSFKALINEGQLILFLKNVEEVKEGYFRFLKQNSAKVFEDRTQVCFKRFCEVFDGYNYPAEISVRDMRARWGSMSVNGKMMLNLKLMMLDISLIDYVIMHELAHMIEHNHSRRYYANLTKLMPDWRNRKAELDKNII